MYCHRFTDYAMNFHRHFNNLIASFFDGNSTAKYFMMTIINTYHI